METVFTRNHLTFSGIHTLFASLAPGLPRGSRHDRLCPWGHSDLQVLQTHSQDVRKRWIDSVRDYMGLDSWTGETSEFLEVHDGVARLDMQASPPSDGRRASSSGFPSHRAVAGSQQTPQDVSYYPHTRGYLAASTGELVSRDTSHGSSRDGEAQASGSQDSPLPPSGVAARAKSRPVAAEPSLLTLASQQGRLL